MSTILTFPCFNLVILTILSISKQNKDNGLVLNDRKLICVYYINFNIIETSEPKMDTNY